MKFYLQLFKIEKREEKNLPVFFLAYKCKILYNTKVSILLLSVLFAHLLYF